MGTNRPEDTNEDANSNTCDHEALLLRTTRLPECPSEREEETAAALNKKQQPKGQQILTHVLPKTLVEKTPYSAAVWIDAIYRRFRSGRVSGWSRRRWVY